MIEQLSLYRAPTTVTDCEAIADWLRERIATEVSLEDRLLDGADEELPREFARARVLSPYERDTGSELLGIVRYEERVLSEPERGGGVIYDGQAVQDALRKRLPTESLDHAHVVLLDRVLGTWGDHDGRWHKRVSVLGQPALVSVPGLYEAPAKPKAYYEAQQRHALVTGDPPPREVLENEVDGKFLVEDDPRTTDALKGYVLSAVHYLATGEAFCENERCRLSNPHRQPGVVTAQLCEPAFCPEHAAMYQQNCR